jgi:hypothetical protein
MSYNTTAARHVFEARKHLHEQPSICQLCWNFLEISDELLGWLIQQSDRHPFVNRRLL